MGRTQYEHAIDGWAKNTDYDHGSSYVYEIVLQHTYSAKIVKNLLGPKYNDYISDMLSNPTEKEILSHVGTKKLLAVGVYAFIMTDYDPRDFQNDLDSVFVLNPDKTVTKFKKL